jgi:hypothetical protein
MLIAPFPERRDAAIDDCSQEDTMVSHNRPGDMRFARLIGLLVVVISALVLASPASAAQDTPAATPVSAVSADEAIAQVTAEDGTIRFDVAENAALFVWSGDPELTDDLPAGTTDYVTQGYIYPEGTLTESNGVLADGSPEFPDQVIGHWSCYGWWLDASVQLNAHMFTFGPAWGEAMLASEGYSVGDLNVPVARPVTGGTGPYAGSTGVQVETLLGFNASNGGNFRYEIRLAGT